MSETRVAKRHKRRFACEIISEGRSQRAIVLDLSATGVFVQTGTRLPPGAGVELKLLVDDATEPILLSARVARSKQVPQQLTSVARGGVGLRITAAPPAYYEAIKSLDGGESLRQSSSAGVTQPPQPPQPLRARFRVRVKQSDGPRSRSVEVYADDADEALARALAQVGSGWEAVTADAIA